LSKVNKICGIYKIVNKINGKVYIGQSVNIYRRLTAHKNWKKRSTSAIGQAIIKYGIDNFEYIILEVCDKELLNQQEKHWILENNSLSPLGYNLATGGGSEFTYSDESKERMRMAQTGKKQSQETINKRFTTIQKNGRYRQTEEHKAKIAELTRNRVWSEESKEKMSKAKKGQASWNKGKKLSKEHIEKTRLKKIGVPATWRFRKILRNDGVVFNSIKEAYTSMGVDRASIHRVLSGQRKTIKKYSFKYLKEGEAVWQ